MLSYLIFITAFLSLIQDTNLLASALPTNISANEWVSDDLSKHELKPTKTSSIMRNNQVLDSKDTLVNDPFSKRPGLQIKDINIFQPKIDDVIKVKSLEDIKYNDLVRYRLFYIESTKSYVMRQLKKEDFIKKKSFGVYFNTTNQNSSFSSTKLGKDLVFEEHKVPVSNEVEKMYFENVPISRCHGEKKGSGGSIGISLSIALTTTLSVDVDFSDSGTYTIPTTIPLIGGIGLTAGLGATAGVSAASNLGISGSITCNVDKGQIGQAVILRGTYYQTTTKTSFRVLRMNSWTGSITEIEDWKTNEEETQAIDAQEVIVACNTATSFDDLHCNSKLSSNGLSIFNINDFI